jgi:hypothetical protein
LYSDKVFVSGTELDVFVGCKDFVDTFLAEKVIFQIVWILTGSGRRSCIHPLQFLGPLFTSLLFLKSLKFLQLTLFLLLLT